MLSAGTFSALRATINCKETYYENEFTIIGANGFIPEPMNYVGNTSPYSKPSE